MDAHSKRLAGTNALVTGGSRGLGRALGEALADAGARVVLVARAAEPLDDAVAAIRRAGGEAYAIAADVADKDAPHAVAGQAAALLGSIDLLVNNASTLGPVPLRLLLDTDCEDLESALSVNLVGPFRLAKPILGSMVLRGRGIMIGITSDASVEAYPGWGAYSVTKAGLDHLTRIFAAELQDTSVKCFNIDPGDMDTRMHSDAMPDADPSTLGKPADAARRILEVIRHSNEIPNGARLSANQVEEV